MEGAAQATAEVCAKRRATPAIGGGGRGIAGGLEVAGTLAFIVPVVITIQA